MKTSSQPRSGAGTPTDTLTTWIVERTDSGWGEMRLLPSLRDAAAPTISAVGNLFFYLDIEGERNIYLSEHLDGEFTPPKKLGPAINMPHRLGLPPDANCPSVTPAGRFLFFPSFKELEESYSEEPITYDEKLRILENPGNGSADIYRVSASIIDAVRPPGTR